MATAPDTTVTILDHFDNIRVLGDVFHEPVNEYWALICLNHGMEFLYRQALQCDHAVKRQLNPNGTVRFFGGGNLPAFTQVPRTLLTCAFHWYAISACQYVRTVGAIAYRQDPTRPLPRVRRDCHPRGPCIPRQGGGPLRLVYREQTRQRRGTPCQHIAFAYVHE